MCTRLKRRRSQNATRIYTHKTHTMNAGESEQRRRRTTHIVNGLFHSFTEHSLLLFLLSLAPFLLITFSFYSQTTKKFARVRILACALCRDLRCLRNTIHANLFLTHILSALLWILTLSLQVRNANFAFSTWWLWWVLLCYAGAGCCRELRRIDAVIIISWCFEIAYNIHELVASSWNSYAENEFDGKTADAGIHSSIVWSVKCELRSAKRENINIICKRNKSAMRTKWMTRVESHRLV